MTKVTIRHFRFEDEKTMDLQFLSLPRVGEDIMVDTDYVHIERIKWERNDKSLYEPHIYAKSYAI